MEKIVGIIQARNGNTRLPFKGIVPLAGRPMLYVYIERVKQAKMLNEVVLAIPNRPWDDCLESLARMCGIKHYRADNEDDLVDRYYWCALKHGADIVVRLCADNPLIEPSEVDRIVEYHLASGNDFSSNTHNVFGSGYPDGLGAEVYNIETLKWLAFNVRDARHREHPHLTIYENPRLFKTGSVPCPDELKGYSHLKLDVDTPKDHKYISAIFDKYENPTAKEYLCSL